MATQYHISPIGPFQHPWLNKPDTKFNADGLFSVGLILTGKTAEDLKAKIDGAVKAAFNEHTAEMKPGIAKQWSEYRPYTEETDDDGEPTGKTIFDFKQNAKIKLKDGSTKDVQIELRDAADNVFRKAIFPNSEGRILFSMRPIVMTSSKQVGVRLDFAKVQVTKLVQGGGGRGFGAVDGGFVADGEEQSFGSAQDHDDEAGEY